MWTDYVCANGDEAETSFVAVGTAGNEIDTVYIKNGDNTLGTALTQSDVVGSGLFVYDPTTRKIEFEPGEVPDGAELVIFYNRRIKANVLDNLSDNYSTNCTIYLDAFGEDNCSNVYRIQFYIPRADFDGNFDLSFGDAQAIHNFSAEALAGSCGMAGKYFTYTIFSSTAEDAA